jgi:hypothetical protein
MGGAAIYYIALDKQNNIYVAENANDKIEKLAPNGTSLMVFGSPGSLPGQFINDKGVYVDSNGNIYVADSTNNRIQKFDSQGNFIFQFGKIGTGPGQLHNPRDVVDDNGGNLWVSDTDNHRIQEFDKNGNYIKQIVYAQPAFTVSASPSSGTYSTIPTITLTSSRTPSTIFYTTDGTTPTISSPSGPSPVIVAVNTNSTLKFFAKDSFGNTSPTSIAVYTIFNSSIIIQMNDTVSSMGLNVYKDNQTQDEIASPTSQLVGKSIDTIVVDLKKTGLPSGPVQVGVFTNTLSVKKLFGTIDASALTSSFKTYSFSLTPAQSYKIQAGDRIGIKFTGGDSSNKVVIMEDATNSFDGMNSYLITYDTAWQYHNFRDLYMILSLHQH